MANDRQLRRFKEKGVDAWHKWKEENFDVEIDLLIYKKLTKPRKFLFFNIFLVPILTLLALTSFPALACVPATSKTLTFNIPVRKGYGSQTQDLDNPVGKIAIPGSGEIIRFEGSPVADSWNIQAFVNGKRVFQENNASVGSKAEFEVCGRPGKNEIKLVVETDQNTNSNLIINLNGKLCLLVIDFNGVCS